MENVLQGLDFIRCSISRNPVYYRGNLTMRYYRNMWELEYEDCIEEDTAFVLYQGNDEHVLRTLIGFHLELG